MKPNKLEKIAFHLRKYLLLYTIIAIVIGWGLGLYLPEFVKHNKMTMKTLTTVFVFFMIYPMMINLNLQVLGKMLKRPKAVVMSFIYNFVITPIIAIILAKIFIPNPELALGFFLVMLIPGGSMSIGYTGLADGSIEVATIALGANFVLIPFLLPVFLKILASSYHIHVPLGILIKSIIIVLIVPMILGVITRKIIIKRRGEKGFMEIKPLFSIVTMSVMFLIVGIIFFMKAGILLAQWKILILLSVVTLIYLIVMLSLITVTNKIIKLDYKAHMGIVFLSTSKNNGTAIAIAMMMANPMLAIPAAILPLYQVIFLIGYLYLVNPIKRYFGEITDKNIEAVKEG